MAGFWPLSSGIQQFITSVYHCLHLTPAGLKPQDPNGQLSSSVQVCVLLVKLLMHIQVYMLQWRPYCASMVEA